MTAPTNATASTGSSQPQVRTNTSNGANGHRRDGDDEDSTPKIDQTQQRPVSVMGGDGHPELDDFVNEFYDGE